MASDYIVFEGIRVKKGVDPSDLSHLGFTWREYDPGYGAYCINETLGMVLVSRSGEVAYSKLNLPTVTMLLKLMEKGFLEFK